MDEQQLTAEDLLTSMDVVSAAMAAKQIARPKRAGSRQNGTKPPASNNTLSSRLQQQKARLQKAAKAEQQQHDSSSSRVAADNHNSHTPASDDETDGPAAEASQPRSRTPNRSISPAAFATITVHKAEIVLQHSSSICKQPSIFTCAGSRSGMNLKLKQHQAGDDQVEQQFADQLLVGQLRSRPSSRRTSRSQVGYTDKPEGSSEAAGERHQADSRVGVCTSGQEEGQECDLAARKKVMIASKDRRDAAAESAGKQLCTVSGPNADGAAAAAAAAAAIAAAAVVAAAMPNPDNALGADEHAAAAIKAAKEAAAAAHAAEQAALVAAVESAAADTAEQWPGLTQQQQFAEKQSARPRKRIGRPPKAAVGSMPAPAVVCNQHQQQRPHLGRLSSAGDGRRISVDEPYRHASVAGHVADLNSYSQAEMATASASWQDVPAATGVAAAVASPCGVRTRLSMRSVAYLEDLLQQTEAETTVDGSANDSKTQHAGGAGTTGSAQHARPSILEHRRLSVGNLIISPPMSRATSTSLQVLQAGGSSRPNSGEAARVVKLTVTKQQSNSKADAASSKLKAEQIETSAAAVSASRSALQDRHGSRAALKAGSCKTSVAPPADDQPLSGRCNRHAAGAGKPSFSAAAMKLPGTAELSRAAAAAVAVWQRVAAAGSKAQSAGDMQSSSDEDSDDPEAAAWAAAATVAAGSAAAATAGPSTEVLNTYVKIQQEHRHSRSRRESYSSDTSSDPSSGSPVFNSSIMGAFTAGPGDVTAAAAGSAAAAGAADAPGGLGAAHGLLYDGMLQGFGGAPAATVTFQGSRPSAFIAGTAAGPAVSAAVGGTCATDRAGWLQAEGPRKSDRQVGLETVQRIDSILQLSRSGVLAPSIGGPASSSAMAGQRASSAGSGTHQQQTTDTAGVAPVAAGVPVTGAIRTPHAGRTNAGAADGAAAAVAVADVERCSVAALCRGLRFDGDITLKEVAMAFQLRDAYDWDEDLEAAAKEAIKAADADPRLKGPRLLSRSPSLSSSSVCPDPEPAPGVLPRNTWMAGNRDGSSPLPSVLAQKSVRTNHHCGSSNHKAELHAADGRGPSLLQRLHKQNIEGHGSLPGSITSSRRESLACSPVCGVGAGDDMTSCPGDMYKPPAPAVLHAALTATQQQQPGAGPRGWQAMLPSSNMATTDTDVDRQAARLQQADDAKAQIGVVGAAAGYSQHTGAQQVQARTGLGRGHHRRKKRNADDSDDDYDPSKPSHQQECYQRKQYVKRQQQQYHYLQQQHQRMMYGQLARLSYGGTILPQQYSAAIQQQMYMLHAAARAGGGLTLQQLQHLQFLQHQQIAAMAAAEQQAAAAAAAAPAASGDAATAANAAVATTLMIGAAPQPPVQSAAGVASGMQSQDIEMQSQLEQQLHQHADLHIFSPEANPNHQPEQANALPSQEQQQELQPPQPATEQPQPQTVLQQRQQPADQQHGQPQQQQQRQQQDITQQAPQLQQQQEQEQQVRRPSYVKRRLTASDAADWLQSHGCQQIVQQPAPNSLQPEQGLPAFGIGPSRFRQMAQVESQELSLRIVSPTAHRDPAHSMLLQRQRHRQLAAAAIAAAAPSPANTSGLKRARKRTAAVMLLDAQVGGNCSANDDESLAGCGECSTDDDSDIVSDVSDAEVGYSAGCRGRGRGRRGRGRGRGFALRGGRSGRSGASLLSRASTPPVSSVSPAPSLTGSQDSPAPSSASPAVGSTGRGRGRGRGRSRSLLGAHAASPGPAGVGLGTPDTAGIVEASAVVKPAAETLNNGVAVAAGAAAAAETPQRMMPSGVVEEVVGQAGNAPASQGRGRGRGRGRRGRGSMLIAGGWGGSFTGSIGSVGSLSAAAASTGRGNGRGRGRGRSRLPPTGAYGVSSTAYGNDAACQNPTGCGAAAVTLPPPKRQRLAHGISHDEVAANVAEHSQQQHALVGMPAWFVAGLADVAGASDPRSVASCMDSQALDDQLAVQQSLVSPGSSWLPRSSLHVLGPVSTLNSGQQLHGAAGPDHTDQQLASLAQQQQQRRRQTAQDAGWVMQVTDGGVVVQMPAGDPSGDGDDHFMQDLGPLSELMQGLGADDGQTELL